MLLVDMSLLALLRLVLLILLIRMVLFALRAGHELATLAAGKNSPRLLSLRGEKSRLRGSPFSRAAGRFGRRRFFRIVCGNSFGLRGSFSAGVRCCLVRFFGIRRGIIGNYGSVIVGSHRSLDSLCLRLFGHFLLWRTSAAFFLYHRGGIFRGSRIGLGEHRRRQQVLLPPAWREPCHRRLRSLFFFRPRLRAIYPQLPPRRSRLCGDHAQARRLRPPPAGRERGT